MHGALAHLLRNQLELYVKLSGPVVHQKAQEVQPGEQVLIRRWLHRVPAKGAVGVSAPRPQERLWEIGAPGNRTGGQHRMA